MNHFGIQPVELVSTPDYWEPAKRNGEAGSVEIVLPDCEIFERRLFEGLSIRTSFRVPYIGGEWKNRFSSIIIYHGIWRFYRLPEFQEPYTIDLGPGHYAYLGDLGWPNAECASFEPVAW